MPDNENLLNTQELEDSVSIDNLTQSPDLDGDDVIVMVHENNGVKSTYKAILRSIANFINKLLHYSTDLHTQNDTIIGAINELADGGGGSADIISTASGTIATFNDGGDNIPVKSLITEITATQAGTGTPAPDNVRAITGVDTVDVIACGKNFTQITETTDSHNGITYTFNNDGTISASGSVPSGNSYKNVGHFILQAGTYTISGLPSSLVAEARKCAMVLCKDAYSGSVNIIKTIYSNIALSDQFTLTEATDCYLRIYVYAAAGAISDVIFAPQIELDTSATSFEKFKGTTHTITLPETIYKGEVDVANGKGTKLFNAVDLGDLTYTYDSVNRRMTATLSDLKSTGTRATSFICSCFQTIDDGRELVNVPNNSVYSGNVGNLNVYFQTSDYTDPATFKTAMTGQTLVYPIEDVSIDLAPVKIPTLAGLNNIFSSTGDIEVEYFNSNANQTSELIDAKQEFCNYSYDEKVVGKWLDGSPLYEKTLLFNNVKLDKSDSTSELVHGISNIGSVRFVSEVYFDFSGGVNGWSPANNGLWNNGVYNFYWVCGETSLYILSASGVYFDANPNRSYLVKIRYTKA